MYISSFNVNSINARINNLVSYLNDHPIDVLLLQEIKSVEENFPYKTFEDLGYNIYANCQKSYNGVAILSKFPLSDIEINLPTFEDNQSRYIEAWVNYNNGGFRVASVYAPNGNPINSDKYDYKLKWLNKFYIHAKKLLDSEEKVILAGDYNICPSKLDVANENMIICAVCC